MTRLPIWWFPNLVWACVGLDRAVVDASSPLFRIGQIDCQCVALGVLEVNPNRVPSSGLIEGDVSGGRTRTNPGALRAERGNAYREHLS